MSSVAILDVHCVLDSSYTYMIKELSIVDTNTLSTQHWIFKHSQASQNAKSRSVNKWLKNNYHQLPLEHGDVDYKELPNILKSLTFDIIYVKGEQKQKMIKDIIPQIEVHDIKQLGCPRLGQICDEETLPYCIFHKELNIKQCTFFKVFALRKWYINNCQ